MIIGIYWNDKSKCWILKWFDKDEKKPKSKQFKITEKYNKEETKKIVDEFKNDLYEDDTIELVVDDYLKLENFLLSSTVKISKIWNGNSIICNFRKKNCLENATLKTII